MVEAINILTSISVLLFAGIIISMLATWLKLPDIILLILGGVALGAIQYKGAALISFPLLFLSSISLLALAMIVFDAAAGLRLRQFDTFSFRALKFVFIFLLLDLVLFSVAAFYILDISATLSILLATILLGTSPEIVLTFLKGSRHKVVEILKLESIINTPLTVLLPFIVVDVAKSIKVEIVAQVLEQLGPFLTKFVAGIGAGVLVAIILYQVLKKGYSAYYSPLAVMVAALLTYVLAENLGGNGVLAVTTLGLFFGNMFVKQKVRLLKFETVFAKALNIFVFVLVGLAISVPLTRAFFVQTISLFVVYLFIRFLAVELSFVGQGLLFKEKLFMTFNSAKGIATVAVVFLFAFSLTPGTQYYLPGLKTVLDVSLVFVIYSILLSTLATRFAKYFIKQEIVPETIVEKEPKKPAKKKKKRRKR